MDNFFSIRNDSLVRCLKVFFISSRDYIALEVLLHSHYNVKSGLEVIQTYKFFSNDTMLSLEIDSSSFIQY